MLRPPETADLVSPIDFAHYATGGAYQRARHLQYLQQELMATLYGPWDVLVAMAPPRSGKSEFLSRWVTSWLASVYPESRSILTSYSVDLARTHSRWVRDTTHRFAQVFGHGGINPNVSSATDWQTMQGGGLLAAGVGGGITGRGADKVFLIDDSLKNAEQAISETVREAQWEWFQTTAFTRLEPGCRLIALGCLVGDTPVSVLRGVKPIRDIRAGDIVETFDNGNISHSVVRNHAMVGHDKVFRVTMRSGRIVLGNERHPFLVNKNGALQWVRLKNLRPGNKLIVNAKSQVATKRDMQGECVERTTANFLLASQKAIEHMQTVDILDHASGMDALSLQSVKDFATTTTVLTGCAPVSGYHLNAQHRSGGHISNIGMVLPSSSTKKYSRASMEFALSAENRLPIKIRESIRTGIFSSIIVTTPKGFVDYSATPAILLQDTLKHPNVPLHLLDTSVFTNDEVMQVQPEGVEKVFDIEVEGTENFIANGIVTHNTRWHEDDLLGKILKAGSQDLGLRVREVRLPALAEPTDYTPDPLGRQTDEPLWPERWGFEALSRIRDTLEPYWWNALYQQRLGSYGHNEWPSEYFYGIFANDDEWPEHIRLSATALDPSKGKSSHKGDYSAIVNTGYHAGYLWVEADIARRPVPKMMRDLVEFNMRVRPTVTGIEGVAFQELLASDYIQAQEEAGSYRDDPELIDNTVNKELRIARLGLWLRLHRIKVKRNASGEMLVNQLKEFPNGKHDDGCFAAGTMVETSRGSIPIEQVVAGDIAFTRLGWKQVLASACTGRRNVIEHSLSDGTKLLATAEHPVYDGHSFSPLHKRCEVYKCDHTRQKNQSALSTKELASEDTQKPSSGRTECITHLMQVIGEMGSEHFTKKYGKMLMDLSQKDVTYITRTAIHSTTQSKTSPASRKKNTVQNTQGQHHRVAKGRGCPKQHYRLLPFGIDLLKVANGTPNTQRRSQQACSTTRENVTIAENLTKQKRWVECGSVQQSAGSDCTPLSVLQVCARRSIGEQSVYNLTVEGGEYLANGIVVHNCDALEMSIRLLMSICEDLGELAGPSVTQYTL